MTYILGAVSGMKRRKLDKAMDALQPRVEEHKTRFTEVANIIFGDVTENMLENWWRVLDECNPDSQYVFLTIDGDAGCKNEKG